MLRFECDYGEGAAPAVLELMQKTNLDQTPGYGEDEFCQSARALLRQRCQKRSCCLAAVIDCAVGIAAAAVLERKAHSVPGEVQGHGIR